MYASAPNPAVHVRIDGGGWADFGAGVIPANSGARVLNAVDLAVVGSRDNPDNALVVAARSWLPHTEYKGQPGWFALMKERLGEQAERTRTTFVAAAKAVVMLGGAQRRHALEDLGPVSALSAHPGP